MRIAGPTLALRPPVAADAEALFALGADPEVTHWFSWGPYRTLEEPRAWIAEQVERRADGEALALVVEHPEAGVVGITELVEWVVRDRRAMIGTWLGRDWWGTGVNAASKELILTLAFAHCGLQRVGAYADVTNVRSQHSLVRAGFRHEGTLRHWHRHGELAKDVEVYGLLRAEWEARPHAAATLEGELPPAFDLTAPRT